MKKLTVIIVAILALLTGVWVNTSLKVDFTTLDDQNYRWQSLQGSWVVVNYFAEWCAPCLREIPELNDFYQQDNAEEIKMFGVSFDALDKKQLNDLKRKYDIQFPVIQFLETLPWGKPPASLPTTYILGPDGKVRVQLKGEQSADKLLQTIEKLKGL